MENQEKRHLYRKGLYLEYFTVGYNMLEAAASIYFGKAAKSIALIGFGLDSIVESLSGLVLIWRLKKQDDISEEEEEKVEKRAMKFVAVTFFILGIYVLFESVKKLILSEAPEPSLPGIIIAVLSLLIMPVLAFQKRSVGRSIQSQALIADSKETLACSFLSLALLMGLGLNVLFNMWYADTVAGLFIVFFLFKEGREIWEEANE